MVRETKQILEELKEIKFDLDYIKDVLNEDYELSDEVKKSLKEARETSESEYVDLDDI
jgi:conjugal transfer/entry exclusion protein